MQPVADHRADPPRRGVRGCLPVVVVVLLLVIAVLVLLLARGNGQPTATPVNPVSSTTSADEPPTTQVPGSTAVTTSCAVTQGIVTRECAIIEPPNLPAGTKLPVVFLLHGFGDGPGTVRDSGAWTQAVLDRRFVLVTPSGVLGSWNAGSCCGPAQATGVDDTSYLATLLDQVARRPEVDPDRIYMAGFSNGGMMTYRFACVSDRIAAMASVSGTRVIDCPPKRALPVLHVHGTADDTVPYQGGSGLVAAIMGVSFPPVPATMQAVATADGCTAAPTEQRDGTLTTTEWDGCGNGSSVRLVTIDGWPHTWPLTGAYDATDAVLNFFGIR